MTTETPAVPLASARAAETRMVASIGTAHFLSHFYFLLLPPLFLFVRAEYDVSYTELALAITVFNIVSAVFQTPAGIFADKVGAFTVLVAGLALESVAFALVGIVPSYWFMIAMFGVAGLANTVFHPCDYALLSHHIPKERVGRAFSIHTFSGILGSAVAPATVLYLHTLIGWRGAFVAAGIAGLAISAVLLLQRTDYADSPHLALKKDVAAGQPKNAHWELLLSGPILRNFFFFTALAAISVGVQNYSVVAWQALFGTSLAVGNAALTGHLLLSAIGVLIGGLLVTRVHNHGVFAALGIAVTGVAILLTGLVDLGALALMAVMAIGGFTSGVVMPSRDMIVRSITPPGLFGTVFGFVTTGFNVAGAVFPLVFGALMDHSEPRAVFLLSAACCVLSVVAVLSLKRRPRAAA